MRTSSGGRMGKWRAWLLVAAMFALIAGASPAVLAGDCGEDNLCLAYYQTDETYASWDGGQVRVWVNSFHKAGVEDGEPYTSLDGSNSYADVYLFDEEGNETFSCYVSPVPPNAFQIDVLLAEATLVLPECGTDVTWTGNPVPNANALAAVGGGPYPSTLAAATARAFLWRGASATGEANSANFTTSFATVARTINICAVYGPVLCPG